MRPLAGIVLTAAVSLLGPLGNSQEATLRGFVLDGATGLPTPCTVAITDATGRIVTEKPSLQTGFRCKGEFLKQLPAGRTRVRVSRGFETRSVEQEVDLRAGQEAELKFLLRRTVDLRQRGWYAGDSHAHMFHGERTIPVEFDDLKLAAQAEDLQLLSVCQDWDLPSSTPEVLERELDGRSTPDCRLTWNLEAPKNYYKGDAARCLGHCWTLGMQGRSLLGQDVISELFSASAWDYESSKPSFANFESHRLIHAQGGTVFYTHPARWWMGPWGGQGGYPKVESMRVSNMAVELPLDVLVGPTFDGIDVLTSSGEWEANNKAFQLWCLLLNHGYRLAPTASSDSCFDRSGGATPGSARTYTWVKGGFSLERVAAATARGNTFATTGPLLLAALDGAPPGTERPAGKQQRVLRLEAWASGDDADGLRRLEVYRNGTLFWHTAWPTGQPCVETNLPIREFANAWYCARAVGGKGERQVAVTGAFYFRGAAFHAPLPVLARVRARILDDSNGQLLAGSITEITYSGTLGYSGRRHVLGAGEGTVLVPGIARLRAEAPGYGVQILSPFLDSTAMVKAVTSLTDEDLLNWETYERIRKRLGEVELEFRLRKRGS